MNLLIFIEKALSIVFWVLVIFGFDTVGVAILTLICAVIHEIGHISVLLLLKKKTKKLPNAKIYGLRIGVKELSYIEEISVALGGPIINLFVAIAAFLHRGFGPAADYMQLFGFLNLMTMATNLFPITEHDGYKIIEATTMMFSKNPNKTKRLLSAMSFTLCMLMCFIALYFMLKIGEGYWIFAIFISTVISEIRTAIK